MRKGKVTLQLWGDFTSLKRLEKVQDVLTALKRGPGERTTKNSQDEGKRILIVS